MTPSLASTLGSRLLPVSFLPALLLGAAIGACTSDSSADCTPGTDGCECVNGSCYPGLSCGVGVFANTCFPSHTNSSGDTDGGDGDGDGDSGDGDGDGDGDGETDCTQTPCAGFTWCDVESGQCEPGCEFNSQCAGDIVCDTDSHSCECPGGTFECAGECIPDGLTCEVCGDGVIEGDEDCDGNNLGGATCASFGFTSGTLNCVACSYDTSNCVNDNPDLFDGFESGNLLSLPWTTSPPAWSVVTTQPYAGTYVAASGLIGDSQETVLELTVMVPAGAQLRFWHRESSEAEYDGLFFFIDGDYQAMWSGITSWTQAVYPVPAGLHTFAWVYAKDGSISDGDDRVYIDNVSIAP
jgi:hypothetical protein